MDDGIGVLVALAVIALLGGVAGSCIGKSSAMHAVLPDAPECSTDLRGTFWPGIETQWWTCTSAGWVVGPCGPRED